jgi:ubiquinone/menaquinone biosynthesis C-methylase UbiE
MNATISEVKGFWDANPCQSALSQEADRRRYFEDISKKRFQGREWHVPTVAQFTAFRGKDVLEVGCGIATDGIEFARNGARYTGVDLTPKSIQLAEERFALFGVTGKFEVANAEERLPFNDDSFDHVYSFGVIHHSPIPERIVREIYRVLRRGGTLTVMLYNRSSINYYGEIMFLRRIFRWCLLPAFMPRLLAAITGFDRWKLEGHRDALRKKVTHEQWVSMNTDGPFCPLAKVYNEAEAALLFKDFADVRQQIWEFNVEHWPILKNVLPTTAERWIGRRWGWHRIIYGRKPPITVRPIAQLNMRISLEAATYQTLTNFTSWLDRFGETSLDHQTFFAGRVGRAAKALYYDHKLLGTAAVAPMIFLEAFAPSARRFFHRPIRFPIADAHYAMGFAFLFQVTNDEVYLHRAIHFLEELKKSRSPGFAEYAWGYPYDWVTRNGTIQTQTPLITSTPYAYEAFFHVQELDGREEWKDIMASIARHAFRDIKDFPVLRNASSCSYTPFDSGGVINAAAYRSFLLTSASQIFEKEEYWLTAERNLNFVLDNQNPDGSWYYAVDGVRDFVDHYHTCFVMKALAKIHALTGHSATLKALRNGISYYVNNLFDADGLPKPFSRAPRLTVYKRELYDCAECINLCVLLRDRFPVLNGILENAIAYVLDAWVKTDGSFRSRKLYLGWDNVPMHRWGQAQMFRSLAFYLHEAGRVNNNEYQATSAPAHQLSTLKS